MKRKLVLLLPFFGALTIGVIDCSQSSAPENGAEADADLFDARDTAIFDGAYSEVGRCYFEGWDPSSGISCEAGSVCAVGKGEGGPGGSLICVRDDATPITCGVVGCNFGSSSWPAGCSCANVPAGACACTYLTSTARAKRDIAYVDPSTEKRLHDDVMTMKLATYRYKPGVTGEDAQHLGFIIEDMPHGSPAVLPSRDKVDLYGYVSMTVAALKVQERELAVWKKRIEQREARSEGVDR